MSHRTRRPRRRPLRASAALLAVAAAWLLLSPAAADDRDLLRFDSAKPYLFIVLDTSASMAMKMGENEWAPGGADGPDSRLYQAKQALFNTLQEVNDVHFGFAGYDQDFVHATAKHWLYYSDQEPGSGWPIDFPRPDLWDSDGDTSVLTRMRAIPRTDADGNEIVTDPDTRVTEIGRVDLVTGELLESADLLTFGPPLDTPAPDSAGRIVGGSCSSPLELDDELDRQKVQSLPISSTNPTFFWLREGNRRYLMRVSRTPTRPNSDGTEIPNFNIGQDGLRVRLQLWQVSGSCVSIDTVVGGRSSIPDLLLNLRLDPELSQFFYVNQEDWGSGGSEQTLDLWEGSDIFSAAAFPSSPHTGLGWEGNYDSGEVTGDGNFDDHVTVDDFACDPAVSSCVNASLKPMADHVIGAQRAEDYGDMIPFDWNSERKAELLMRFDPLYDDRLFPDEEFGDFRIAKHFANTPVDGRLPLLDTGEIPLVAADQSPLARAITDVRCWVLGDSGKGSNKCKDGMWGEEDTPGWLDVACDKDTAFGCRKLFMIIISDGEDSITGGNDASSSASDLDGSAGMQIWVLNVGDPDGCDKGGGLHPIVQNTVGECINVSSQERLRQVLESLLGQIRTTARSFASAAVPSVQATVEQKIYLTSFLPFNDEAVWKGSVHAFLKPLPVTSNGVPQTELKCDGSGSLAVEDPTQGCHLWDAGEMLVEKQYPDSGTDFLDLADGARRRVFYAQQTEADGEWPRRMRLFDPLAIDTANSQAVRFDLWRGLTGIDFSTDESDPSVNVAAQDAANALVLATLTARTGTETNPVVSLPPITHQYLLGDVFHSTPVVIGTPANNIYFTVDLYGNTAECDPDDGTASANPGYRCFFQKQRFRRKMLLVGSNDGMLHAFDGGMFRESGTDHWTGADLVHPQNSPFGSFDNGTGKELFAYLPRMAMPTLDNIRPGQEKHQFTVDGTVTVADVFVDPVRQGATAFPLSEDREWRTVVVGGLREGGRGYYALDVTQPDPVVEHEELDFLPDTGQGGSNDPDEQDYLPVCGAGLTEVANGAGVVALRNDADPCGQAPFPAVLWEFTDTFFDGEDLWFADEEPATVVLIDPVTGEARLVEGNDQPDLGDTWSTPNIGRIRVCALGGTACDPTPEEEGGDDDLVDVFVAVVGGGMDVANKVLSAPVNPFNASGNWLYMIDVETGEAIYKQRLIGAAPSEPAAVDTDGDGYLDRIYIGTLAGFLYRVDLDEVVGADGDLELPALTMSDVNYRHPETDATMEISRPRLPPTVWQPRILFDANWNGLSPTLRPRPIYHRPSVIFDAQTGEYVLAFGTGHRENLWFVTDPPQQERFYVFRDTVRTTATLATAMNEAGLAVIDPDLTAQSAVNLLTTNGGWVMHLAPSERVITDAFALSGVTVFSTFVPQIVDGEGEEVVAGCEDVTVGNQGNNAEDEPVCSKQGVSHIFVVNTTNGNGLLFEGDTDVASRYKVAPTFVTNPFAEPGQTKDTVDGNEEGEHTADDLSVNMLRVMESLKELFPPQCKFANYRIDLKTVAADTSLQFIAPIPVCLIESNWKEF